ncbi:NADPH-dependent FMN reductase [Shewanella sp. cp20]|uniref:NADPH-dependent FMN reductase n=1 Tax=Shewanella sp. cp20 TaxID=1521167 RepID=UPI0005A22F44|nr:NADPH-dependent FMN reductase [Shewanella sp. cp20]KIO37170.1 FMN reductase [Shewanella sp. cp20]
MKILAISGSLRKDSYNMALLKAVKASSPCGVEIRIFNGLADIPPFNPDIEPSNDPNVMALKTLVAQSDGLFISSPEYAHGVSGVLKNALDWLVSGEEFVCMPVAIFNTSPRAFHALESLHEIIRTMSGKIVEEACITLPLLSSNFSCEDILSDSSMSASIEHAIKVFTSSVS